MMPSRLGYRCVHKEPLGCELTTTAKCCMCADRRPLSETYPTYVDGTGMENTGTRYQKYCWRCRDHWEAQDELGLFDPEPYTDPLPYIGSPWPLPATTPPTSSTLSPFSGVGRRLPRQHPSDDNPIRIHTSSDDSNGTSSVSSPSIPQRGGRRSNNRADHYQTSTNRATARTPGHDARAQPRRPPQENPFGTRAEAEAPDYQSPLGMMFSRAWTRYRDAEDARRQTEAEIQDQMVRLTLNDPRPQQTPSSEEARLRLGGRAPAGYQAYPSRSAHLATQIELSRPGGGAMPDAAGTYRGIGQYQNQHGHPSYANTNQHPYASTGQYLLARPRLNEDQSSRDSSPERENPIDVQPSRPKGLSDEQMTVSIACKICFEQKMDIILFPCHHIACCHWCASIMRDRAYRERLDAGMMILRPVRGEGWKCPTCRKSVEHTKKIFLG